MALTWDQINAITEKKFIPKLYDNIFDANFLLKKLEAKKELLDGGTKIMVPLNYALNNAGGWYSGAQTLDNSDTENITAAEFAWKQIYESISINRRDELMNSGDAAKLKFVKSKVEIAEKTIKDRLATGVYNAGSDAAAVLGVRSFLSTSNSYGGISQSAYSWWQSNVDSTTTTLSIGALQSMWSTIAVQGETPDLLVATTSNYDRYYSLLQPQQRFMGEEKAEGGFVSLMFNGVPFVMDSKCPSGHVIYLNLDYLKLYIHKDENFRMEPFAKPINQNVKVAHVFAMLALASSNNRMHGALTALTA